MTKSAPLSGVSVFLPCHNEEGNIERVAAGLEAELPRIAERYEIVVVDDGSRDRTGEIADRLAAANPHLKVVHHPVNRGYGAAVSLRASAPALSRGSCCATATASSRLPTSLA